MVGRPTSDSRCKLAFQLARSFWSVLDLDFESHPFIFRLSKAAQIVYLWTIMYFIMISLNQSSARYLIPILPFAYIFAADVLCGWYNRLRKNLN